MLLQNRWLVVVVLFVVAATVMRAQGEPDEQLVGMIGVVAGPQIAWFGGAGFPAIGLGDTVPGIDAGALHGLGFVGGLEGARLMDGWRVTIGLQYLRRLGSAVSGPLAATVVDSSGGTARTLNARSRTEVDISAIDVRVIAGFHLGERQSTTLMFLSGVSSSLVVHDQLRRTLEADAPLVNRWALPTENEGRTIVVFDDRIDVHPSVDVAWVVGLRAETAISTWVVGIDVLARVPIPASSQELRATTVELRLHVAQGIWRPVI